MDKQYIAERVQRRFLAMNKTAVSDYDDKSAEEIAVGVILFKVSKNWGISDSQSAMAAKEAEERLAMFNIGLIDAEHGTWAYVRGGTDFYRRVNYHNWEETV